LWWLEDVRLPPRVRDLINDPTNDVVVSVATVWEMAIKRALNKLTVPDDLERQLDRHAFSPLPITMAHALSAGGLPRHHTDPFDRMLIAQARLEGLTLVSADGRFPAYDVALLTV